MTLPPPRTKPPPPVRAPAGPLLIPVVVGDDLLQVRWRRQPFARTGALGWFFRAEALAPAMVVAAA